MVDCYQSRRHGNRHAALLTMACTSADRETQPHSGLPPQALSPQATTPPTLLDSRLSTGKCLMNSTGSYIAKRSAGLLICLLIWLRHGEVSHTTGILSLASSSAVSSLAPLADAAPL
jgi:hypothetical protein